MYSIRKFIKLPKSFQIINEQITSRNLIWRLAFYDTKSQFNKHRLGLLWAILKPLLLIATFWFVFGIGIRESRPVGDTPFFLWLICGLINWIFLSGAITDASNSVYRKVSIVSKMNFPTSILPTVSIVSQFLVYAIMMIIFVIVLSIHGIYPTIYWIQVFYYMFALLAFVFSISLFFSSIVMVFRDFQQLLSASMRMLMFLSPVFWDPRALPTIFLFLLKLNPFYYLITGFRQTFLEERWFFQNGIYNIYFWLIVFLLFEAGSFIHLRLRHKFVDYL